MHNYLFAVPSFLIYSRDNDDMKSSKHHVTLFYVNFPALKNNKTNKTHSSSRKTITSNVLGKKYATHLTSTLTPSGVNRLLLQCHIHKPKGKGIRISKLSNFCDYHQIAII